MTLTTTPRQIQPGSANRELAHLLEQAIQDGCPDCGSHDLEHNGSTEYRCRVCDHRFGTDCGDRYGY